MCDAHDTLLTHRWLSTASTPRPQASCRAQPSLTSGSNTLMCSTHAHSWRCVRLWAWRSVGCWLADVHLASDSPVCVFVDGHMSRAQPQQFMGGEQCGCLCLRRAASFCPSFAAITHTLCLHISAASHPTNHQPTNYPTGWQQGCVCRGRPAHLGV